MKRFHSLNLRLRAALGLAVMAAAIHALSGLPAAGADTKSGDAKARDAKEKQTGKKLAGADLYSIHCNRCHAERYPTEFNSAQWKTLLTHMRVRANLPARQAREILKYLQEESGS